MYQVVERRWDRALQKEVGVVVYECEDPEEARFVEREVRKTIRRDDIGWYHEGGVVQVYIKEKEKAPLPRDQIRMTNHPKQTSAL